MSEDSRLVLSPLAAGEAEHLVCARAVYSSSLGNCLFIIYTTFSVGVLLKTTLICKTS